MHKKLAYRLAAGYTGKNWVKECCKRLFYKNLFFAAKQLLFMNDTLSHPLFSMQRLTRHLSEGIVVTKAGPLNAPDGPKIIYVNPAFERISGYSAAEVIGKTPRMLQGPKTQRDRLDRIRRGLENLEPVEEELINYHKSGREYWIRFNVTPLLDEHGKAHFFLALERDITARKQAELSNAYNLERLEAVLNTVVDGIISINAQGVILAFNPAAEKIFGYQAQEVIGQNVKMLMPRSEAKHHDGYISNYLHTGKAQVIGVGREVTAQRKDGTLFPIDLGINEVRHGKERFFVGITRDISERKQAEEKLLSYAENLKVKTVEAEQARIEAEQANAYKSTFLANMSHELRTPLHTISGFAEVMLEKLETMPSEKRKTYLEMIQQSSERLLNLINDLLDLSKLEAGMMRFHFTPVAIAPLLKQAVSNVQQIITEKQLDVQVVDDSAMEEVVCDAARITQVCINMVSNAAKFSGEGTKIMLTLKKRETKDGTWLWLECADQGVGIPEKELEAVFDKFIQSSKTSSGAGGTGLGLSICREIMEAHQGTIHAENNEAGGASFIVQFPLNLAPSKE